MYKVSENRKCTEWPQTELEHVAVISILYTLNTYPLGPNFGPCRSTTNRFRDKNSLCTRSVKIRNAPSDSKMNLKHLAGKRILYTQNTYSLGPNFGAFHSRISRFRDICARSRKLKVHRMTPNWIWTRSRRQYSIYSKYLPLKLKCCSVSLYDKAFPRYSMCKVGEYRKNTEWPHTELEHLTVKSILYTKYLPLRYKVWCVSL